MNANERARLGARLRQARRDAGRSQAEVAAAAGIAANTLSAIEAGRKSWDANLTAVMRELDVEHDGGYSPDVDVVMELVGEWLMPMAAEDRSRARRALARFMSAWGSAHADADLRRYIADEDLAEIDATRLPRAHEDHTTITG